MVEQRLDGVKSVFADEMAGMIEQYEATITVAQKK